MKAHAQYPAVLDPDAVGEYPALVGAGGGYVWDEVLEYRVWCHPERGAPDHADGSDYYYAFAFYEEAAEFAAQTDARHDTGFSVASGSGQSFGYPVRRSEGACALEQAVPSGVLRSEAQHSEHNVKGIRCRLTSLQLAAVHTATPACLCRRAWS